MADDTIPDLTRERLLEKIVYDPVNGMFYHVNNGVLGKRAGCFNSEYRHIKINDKNYKEHRLAFLIMTQEWPVEEVDHINGDKFDNRWCNLRPATRSQNQGNSGLPKNNTSGVKGVCWDSHSWRAQIRLNGKQITKRFKKKSDAIQWRQQMAHEAYGEFVHPVEQGGDSAI